MKNLKPCGTFHVLFKGKLVFAMVRFATNGLINMFQFCFALTLPQSFVLSDITYAPIGYFQPHSWALFPLRPLSERETGNKIGLLLRQDYFVIAVSYCLCPTKKRARQLVVVMEKALVQNHTIIVMKTISQDLNDPTIICTFKIKKIQVSLELSANHLTILLSICLDISQETALHPSDIISTLQYLGILKYWKGKHVILRATVSATQCKEMYII